MVWAHSSSTEHQQSCNAFSSTCKKNKRVQSIKTNSNRHRDNSIYTRINNKKSIDFLSELQEPLYIDIGERRWVSVLTRLCLKEYEENVTKKLNEAALPTGMGWAIVTDNEIQVSYLCLWYYILRNKNVRFHQDRNESWITRQISYCKMRP